jgi:hypothetical protein
MTYVKSGGNEKYRYSRVQNITVDFFFMNEVTVDSSSDDDDN